LILSDLRTMLPAVSCRLSLYDLQAKRDRRSEFLRINGVRIPASRPELLTEP
jgi:hypothetical protein